MKTAKKQAPAMKPMAMALDLTLKLADIFTNAPPRTTRIVVKFINFLYEKWAPVPQKKKRGAK